MQIERVQRTSAQFEDELSPRTSLGLHAVFACPLNRSVRIQQNGEWKGNGGSHRWNTSIRAADSLMTIDFFYIKLDITDLGIVVVFRSSYSFVIGNTFI